MLIKKCLDLVIEGKPIDYQLAFKLATRSQPHELFEAADSIRKKIHGKHFDLCSIVNAKSGKCSEDCRFCAQSAHYNVEIDSYEIIDDMEAVSQGKDNEAHGVRRFSLVSAGRSASLTDLTQYGSIYKQLSEQTRLQFCASMGMLTYQKAEILKSYGVKRYHCNLETCRSFFPKVCTTHTWEEKVETIKIAQEVGLEVCSGGIIGMGESLEHRLELAFELRDLGVLSIPINVLTPIANTPFAELEPLKLSEILTCIAMFRFINPEAIVRLAGGRNQYGEDQYTFFSSGANGAIVGNYLTTAGNSLADDLKKIQKRGFTFTDKENE